MATQEFFKVAPVADTLEQLFNHIQPLERIETAPVTKAVGRVLAKGPNSPIDLPEFVRSTMDGYAVRAADTFGASESLPAYLEVVGAVQMGEQAHLKIKAGQTAKIHTGGMLPTGADAVVMIERTQPIGDHEIEVLAPVAPGENLVKIGEDVAKDSVILPRGHRMRPQDVGGLLAVGILEVSVVAPPVIAIMGSGDEIIHPMQTPRPGEIRDINSYTLAALFEQVGAQVKVIGVAEDTREAIAEMAEEGISQADMLVMTAGSSVSTRDYTRETIDNLGEPGILQHGLAVKPGKPAIIAVCEGKPVIGLPGNPVSAMLVARQIVVPTIQRLLGESPPRRTTVRATLTANIASVTGRMDTVPVRLSGTADQLQAEPVFGKSNLIFTLIDAEGLVTVPLNTGGIKAGTLVNVELF